MTYISWSIEFAFYHCHRLKLFVYIKKWHRPGVFVPLQALALVITTAIIITITGQSGNAIFNQLECASGQCSETLTMYFNPPFSKAPHLTHGFALLDVAEDSNLRIEASVVQVATNTVTLKVRTWNNSIVHASYLTWMASPQWDLKMLNPVTLTQLKWLRKEAECHTFRKIIFVFPREDIENYIFSQRKKKTKKQQNHV